MATVPVTDRFGNRRGRAHERSQLSPFSALIRDHKLPKQEVSGNQLRVLCSWGWYHSPLGWATLCAGRRGLSACRCSGLFAPEVTGKVYYSLGQSYRGRCCFTGREKGNTLTGRIRWYHRAGRSRPWPAALPALARDGRLMASGRGTGNAAGSDGLTAVVIEGEGAAHAVLLQPPEC